MIEFFVGIQEPTWIGRAPFPTMISITRAHRRWGRRPALAPWALDSGGFTALHRHGGHQMPPEEYIETAYKLGDRHAGLSWMSPQDWMCEPSARARTGLPIEEHLERTVQNYLDLKALDDRDLVIPVIQGWEMGDYLKCVDLYESAGVELRDASRVGVGSVCRRQGKDEIADVFEALSGLGLRLHGFGVKRLGLALYGRHLYSADSMAWTYKAWTTEREGGSMCGSTTHKRCSGCFVWASRWYSETQEIIQSL